MTRPVVCDAGPILHLDELDCLDLLTGFSSVLVPATVWTEVERHRPGALAAPFLSKQEPVAASSDVEIRSLCSAFSLDAGETACLELISPTPGAVLLTDDAAARLVVGLMRIEVHGTIGVLLRSIRTGQRDPEQVVKLLDELPSRCTLHITRALLDEVMERVRRKYGLQ